MKATRVFSTDTPHQLEYEMNEFLRHNQSVEILQLNTSLAAGDNWAMYTTVMVYNVPERAEHPVILPERALDREDFHPEL